MSSLEVDIRPGSGIGIFALGSSIWTVLDVLRENKAKFSHVDVKFDMNAAATSPIILNARPHIDLLFTGSTQRLQTICLRQLRSPTLTVTYKSTVISSHTTVLRRSSVNKVFGPTYKGKERLSFPGVMFDFGGADRGESEGGRRERRGEERMEEVEKVVVVQRPVEKGEEEEMRLCEPMLGDLKKAVVTIHEGVSLEFFSPTQADPIEIKLGITTAEDLLCDLGPPLRLHYKQDDRMNIHSTGKESPVEENSYFYNYFQHGVDFLLSGETHRVQKIVLHSNVAGSALFQRYKRCPWEIRAAAREGEDQRSSDEQSSPHVHPCSPNSGRVSVTVADKADTISRLLDSSSDPPSPPSMVLDRASEHKDSVLLIGTTTKLLGFDGAVLEVGEAEDVLSIVLF